MLSDWAETGASDIFNVVYKEHHARMVRSDQITEPTPNSSPLLSFGSLRSPPCPVPSAHRPGAASRQKSPFVSCRGMSRSVETERFGKRDVLIAAAPCVTVPSDGSPSGIKRECGAGHEPKTAAALATVSGEPSALKPLAKAGKAAQGEDPRARRPAIAAVTRRHIGRGGPMGSRSSARAQLFD